MLNLKLLNTYYPKEIPFRYIRFKSKVTVDWFAIQTERRNCFIRFTPLQFFLIQNQYITYKKFFFTWAITPKTILSIMKSGCCWDDKVQFVSQKTEGKNSCHCCCTAPVLTYPNSIYYKLESFSYTINSHGEDYHSVNHFFSILKLQGDMRITLFNFLEWFFISLNFQILMILNLTPVLPVATPKTKNRK